MPPGRAAGAPLESKVKFLTREMQSRNQSRQQTDQGRNTQRECEHYAIDRDSIEPRQPRRAKGDEHPHACYGDSYAKTTAERSQQQALGDKLPGNSQPR